MKVYKAFKLNDIICLKLQITYWLYMLDINFNQIIEMIEKRKNNAYRKVNEEMILLYLEVGKFLYELKENSNYGDKITTKASDFMKNNYPNIKGFTKRNIERMIQFYSTYKDDEIATPLVTQLSWTNNLLILSGAKSKEERHFYLKLSIKNNYSKRELDRQISSAYYERYMLSDGKYRVQVGNHDFFIDLLFYNRELSCLVAFELKLGEFKAEYLGKMNLYLEALDRDVKKEQENPSVGVILCSSKDKDVVEYSISKNMSQTMISEYKLKLIDKKLLETKLKEMKNLIDNKDN